MTCPECGNETRPGSIDGFRYENCCAYHGPVGEPGPSVKPPSVPVQAKKRTEAVEVVTPSKAGREGFVTLPYPPSANTFKVPYCTTCRQSKGIRMLKSVKARDYSNACTELLSLGVEKVKLHEGPIRLTIRLYRPRATGDASNAVKLCEDALTGYAWHDDKQVAELHVYRYEDKVNPRVEITVEEL